MIQVVLAGLVLQKVMTLDEAEYIRVMLIGETVPKSVSLVIDKILTLQAKYKLRKE